MAAKKKQPSKPTGSGTLMGMRSGFQSITGTGVHNKSKPRAGGAPWTFQQVFAIVAGAALLIALVYAFTR